VLKLHCLVFLWLPITLFSQTITGKVYDAESTVSGVKITNITQHISTDSDDNGDFKINGKVNDTILFSSLFHEPQIKIVIPKDFDDVVVVELKKKINELDKVYLNKLNPKKFESTKVESSLQTQVKSDIDEHPYIYNPAPNTNIDFIAIARLIGKLFKKKNIEGSTQLAGYREIKNLFDTDSFFNTQFLSSELKIEKELHPLFIDFCEAKGIAKTLLLKENQMLLIDTLVQYREEFMAMIQENKKE